MPGNHKSRASEDERASQNPAERSTSNQPTNATVGRTTRFRPVAHQLRHPHENAANATAIQAGKAGTFMSTIAPNLSDEILIGRMPTQQINPTEFNKLKGISDFLSLHRAMVTLTRCASDANATSAKAPAYYMPTVDNFAELQKNRQAAGLRTNTNRQTTQGAKEIVEAHGNALEVAMKNAQEISNSNQVEGVKLSKNLLCKWHRLLYPSNQSTSGNYRKNQARAGTTLFSPASQIEEEMEALFAAVQALHRRWIDQLSPVNNTTTTGVCSVEAVYRGLAMAAILLGAVCDIHPFADGNGRLARICSNWALVRLLGLPFSVTVVANQQHRHTYVESLKHVHNTIAKRPTTRANSSDGENQPSVFQPLIFVLLDRTAHAVQEVQRLLGQKSQAAISEEEARIARRVREQTAAGACIICLDDNPNIATLCCGQAVHLNCIAEWLANNATCVNCRNPLPQMPRPPPTVVRVAVASTTSDQTSMTATTEYGTTTAYDAAQTETEYGTTTAYDAAQTEIEYGTTTAYEAAQTETEYGTTTTVIDDTTTIAAAYGMDTTATEATATTGNDAPTTTTAGGYEVDQPPRCVYCNNLAALDCDNGLCGRCCVLHGQVQCARHNT